MLKYLVILMLVTPLFARAQSVANSMDELDPFAPDIQNTLLQIENDYEVNTGDVSNVSNSINQTLSNSLCYREGCAVYALVKRSEQRLYLYLNGQVDSVWKTSTGASGHETPDFDQHPDGRIYDAYTSSKYPGGDYHGLGNMPYVVFISGGFAIHGTAQSNWQYLGRPASHGCIRIHPDNAFRFNRLVRGVGVSNVWVTVTN